MVIEDGGTFALTAEGDGYFSGTREEACPGTLYRLRLDDEPALYPDPASRFQPHGHDGPSQVIDPARYAWSDRGWRGVRREGQVLYEMHIGTFTTEGTWLAAAAALPWLAELGVTVLEVMPVGEFPGRFGWGYDVVHFYAPTRLYGIPDEMRTFVDTAHRLGVGVILDIVYNHCGSIGAFLPAFSPDYFSRKHRNDWGNALNFDGEGAAPVREFFTANADYWIREFHLDGFRLDATQNVYDSSPTHILGEIAARARAAAPERDIVLLGENEPQHVTLLKSPVDGGAGLDALWNDDFHHSVHVAVTGRAEAYYTDYRGAPQELVSAAKRGFLYQGQHYAWQKQRRGTSTTGLTADRFVCYLQNHDQVANSARGRRLHELTTPGRYRAATALLLLLPQTPMLFQGQEFAASSPFMYFADNPPENAAAVANGRRDFMSQFASIAAGGDAWLNDPASPQSFANCKLDLTQRETHGHTAALHRDLIALRRNDPVFGAVCSVVDGAVLAEEAFALRYFGAGGDERLLIVNFGRQLELSPCPEPLLAPPAERDWVLIFSSDDVAYGGEGILPTEPAGAWRIAGHAALVFAARQGTTRAPALPGQREISSSER